MIQLGRPPHRIDLLTGITGVTFDEAFASRESATLDGTNVWFIGRDALLKNKGIAITRSDAVFRNDGLERIW